MVLPTFKHCLKKKKKTMAPCNSGWNFPDNITKQEQKDTGWPGADHTAHDGGGSL